MEVVIPIEAEANMKKPVISRVATIPLNIGSVFTLICAPIF